MYHTAPENIERSVSNLPHQHSLTSENAMTEVALALAMGFFALMILSLVSMGMPIKAKNLDIVEGNTATSDQILAAVLKPETSHKSVEDFTEETKSSSQVTTDDQLIVYYNEMFWDSDLEKLDMASFSSLNNSETGRIILAVDPSLSMTDALDIQHRLQSQISVPNLILSVLSPDWLTALEHQVQ